MIQGLFGFHGLLGVGVGWIPWVVWIPWIIRCCCGSQGLFGFHGLLDVGCGSRVVRFHGLGCRCVGCGSHGLLDVGCGLVEPPFKIEIVLSNQILAIL